MNRIKILRIRRGMGISDLTVYLSCMLCNAGNIIKLGRNSQNEMILFGRLL